MRRHLAPVSKLLQSKFHSDNVAQADAHSIYKHQRQLQLTHLSDRRTPDRHASAPPCTIRRLLTGAHVSVLLSTVVFAVFTALLFAAGCLLQHRTVRSLRAEIWPRLPSTGGSVAAVTEAAVPFRSSDGAGSGRVGPERGTVYGGCGRRAG